MDSDVCLFLVLVSADSTRPLSGAYFARLPRNRTQLRRPESFLLPTSEKGRNRNIKGQRAESLIRWEKGGGGHRQVRSHDVGDVDGVGTPLRRAPAGGVMRARGVRQADGAGPPVHYEGVAGALGLHPAPPRPPPFTRRSDSAPESPLEWHSAACWGSSCPTPSPGERARLLSFVQCVAVRRDTDTA